jgi:hypothetical protein
MGSAGHVMHFGVYRGGNVDALFFMLRWVCYGFCNKCNMTRYAEAVFLHLLGSVGHLVDSDASGA